MRNEPLDHIAIFSSEVVEMALAHAIESKVEAAYRRGDLFEKRRCLMAEWAGYSWARSCDADAGWSIHPQSRFPLLRR